MVAVQIWGMKGSTCTDRALFTAAELGAPVELHAVDITKGQQKTPEHLQRQPFGKVPAAEIDGVSVFESRAICRVIARSSPAGEQLFPSSDLKKVAVFEQWASLESGTITPMFEKVVVERVFKPLYYHAPTDEAATKKAIEDGQTALQVMDKQLGAHQYVTGNFSLVDIFLSTYFAMFAGTPEGKEVLAQYPNIAAWWTRVSGRPAWQKIKA